MAAEYSVFLYKIGMGDVWLNPSIWTKDSLKSDVTSLLQNMTYVYPEI